jgi:hypothetical protein
MVTKSIFICGIHGITTDGDLGSGLLLTPHDNNSELPKIRLTNNKKKYHHFYTTIYQSISAG